MVRTLIVGTLLCGAVAIGAAPVANAQPYEDCTAAAEDGQYNIPSDSPSYGLHLDRDHDGIGCEKN
jgi:hypothetical protein